MDVSVPPGTRAAWRSTMRASGLALAVVLGASGVARAADAQMLTRGGAIVDPLTLRELDLHEHISDGAAADFSLRRMLAPRSKPDTPLTNDELFSLPSMIPLRAAIDREFERYLPMTLNVVVKARADNSASITCSEIARRWLEATGSTPGGVPLAAKLTSQDGPLALIEPANVELLEFNLQIGHIAKSATHDFQTDYLLKVFRRDPSSGDFSETSLENQIDRDRILADPQLGHDFKQWLLAPAQMRALDRGTILIPDEFLATDAIVPTPVGFVRSPLQPEFGLVQSSGEVRNGLFSERDVVAALKQATDRGVAFENIRSIGGFERRLNDITCAGCHQTRGIGGFHFPGVNWMITPPSNETTVPASPHFIGDQARRQNILTAIRDGAPPDYSRGFSSRPQLRGDGSLLGTEYVDGWGAHCYAVRPGEANDPSFRSWTCAKGLACQAIGEGSTERMGMCFVSKR
jgi:hypothetical protein